MEAHRIKNNVNQNYEKLLFNPLEAKARHLYQEITDSHGQQTKDSNIDNLINLEEKFQERLNAKINQET